LREVLDNGGGAGSGGCIHLKGGHIRGKGGGRRLVRSGKPEKGGYLLSLEGESFDQRGGPRNEKKEYKTPPEKKRECFGGKISPIERGGGRSKMCDHSKRTP